MKNFRTISLCLFLCAAVFSCEAPRTNPLDPQNPDYNFGQLQGFVYIVNTRQPIQNVTVIWKNQNTILQTDANGEFSISGLYKKNGMIYFQKDGFGTDSSLVDWGGQSNKRLNDEYLNYSIGQVYGYIKNGSGKVIPGAKVYLKSRDISVQTNALGYYNIDNLPRQKDSLLIQADGYSSSTLPIIWGSNQNTEVDAALNSNPVLNDLRIYTSITNYYALNPTSLLLIQAQISDADGFNEIDSVFVKCDGLNLYQPLSFNFTSQYFELTIQQGVTYLPSLEDALGKSFQIIVKDKAKRLFNVGSSSVIRIIRDQITFFSPANGAPVDPNPILLWRRFQPGFNFHYMIQVYLIYNNSSITQLIWQKDNISKDDVQITLDASLISGQNYYWVIWCIDDFLDRSRSTEATFTAK